MRCFNCQMELINVGSVCPYCHTNPLVPGSAPYSGTQSTPAMVWPSEAQGKINQKLNTEWWAKELAAKEANEERDNAIIGNGSLVAWLFGWGKKKDK